MHIGAHRLLKSRTAAETEKLRLVVRLLRECLGQIKADWPEGRRPDEARAEGRSNGAGIGETNVNVVFGTSRPLRASDLSRSRAVGRIGRERSAAFVAPKRAGISEDSRFKSEIAW